MEVNRFHTYSPGAVKGSVQLILFRGPAYEQHKRPDLLRLPIPEVLNENHLNMCFNLSKEVSGYGYL